MDVIPDTNVYYALVNTQGAQFTSGNIFTERITYLRRTKSNLVIPRLVFDEFSQRYFDLISRSNSETIDPSHEVESLQELLINPTYFKSLLQDDYGKVSLDEVVHRGIHRIPPLCRPPFRICSDRACAGNPRPESA